ncbi:MAG: hypothetical protein DWQ34_07525 [Planctomycetota bacterium]|nr:MAG: hypothetical protein DWQ34_07525 [Planctomycetota bacterium]REK27270.1 MAG: hypothetical protein DWQ41_07835 [Planctomycetota bacterium]REK36709.1 MAG: hypothetical protein DWQ45_08800 [Planctomycetota bacterium]
MSTSPHAEDGPLTPTTRTAVIIALLLTTAIDPGVATAEQPAQQPAFSLSEQVSRGAVVGRVSPTGGNSGGGEWTQFEIVGGNEAGAFAIDSDTGDLTVANPAAIDFEQRSVFSLSVRARLVVEGDAALRSFAADLLSSGADGDVVGEFLARTTTQSVPIHVTDANESPQLPAQSLTLVAGGQAASSEIAKLNVIDPDADDHHVFSIISGDEQGLIALDPETGAVSINSQNDFGPGRHVIPLTVRVVDRAGLSDATTVNIRVVQLPVPSTTPPDLQIADETTPAQNDKPAPIDEESPATAALDAQPVAQSKPEQSSDPTPAPVTSNAAQEKPTATELADRPRQANEVSLLPAEQIEAASNVATAPGNATAWLRFAPFLLVCLGLLAVVIYLQVRRKRTRANWNALATGVATIQQPDSDAETMPQQTVDSRSTETVPPQRPSTPLQFPTPEQLAAEDKSSSAQPAENEHREAAPDDSDSHVSEVESAAPETESEEIAAHDLATHDQMNQVSALIEGSPADETRWTEPPSHAETLADSDEPASSERETEPETVAEDVFEVDAESTTDVVEDVSDSHETESHELPADPLEVAAVQEAEEALADSDSPLGDDPRLDSLRKELSDLFGVSVDELKQRSGRTAASEPESSMEDDATALAEETDTTDADVEHDSSSGLLSENESETDVPEEETLAAETDPIEDEPCDSAPSMGLSTSRFLEQFKASQNVATATQAVATTAASSTTTQTISEEPVGEAELSDEPESQIAQAEPTQPVAQTSVSRVNKSAVRQEITSLRDLANQHARGILAKHEKKNKIRDRLFLSGILTGVLCVAGMSLLASAVGGTGQWVGWGMLACGAVVFAMCVYTFQRLTDNDQSAVAHAESNTDAPSHATAEADANAATTADQPSSETSPHNEPTPTPATAPHQNEPVPAG